MRLLCLFLNELIVNAIIAHLSANDSKKMGISVINEYSRCRLPRLMVEEPDGLDYNFENVIGNTTRLELLHQIRS